MKNEINTLKEKYLDIKPSKFLEERGVSDLWNRIDEVPRSRYQFFTRYLVIAAVVLMGLAGFISVTYAATPGSVLYEVKKITQEVVRHVPLVSFVVPQKETPKTSLSPAPATAAPAASIKINGEGKGDFKGKENIHSDNGLNTQENQQEKDIKGVQATQEGAFIEKDNNNNKDNNSGNGKNSENSNRADHASKQDE